MILLVDDDPRILRATSQMLIDSGYEVVTADSGGAGMALLANTPAVTMIISDVLMPGMKGTEFITRAKIARPELGVLFISGDIGDTPLAEFGGAEVLAKPFTAAALLAALRRIQ